MAESGFKHVEILDVTRKLLSTPLHRNPSEREEKKSELQVFTMPSFHVVAICVQMLGVGGQVCVVPG